MTERHRKRQRVDHRQRDRQRQVGIWENLEVVGTGN